VSAADLLREKAKHLRDANQQAAEHRRFKRGPFDFTVDRHNLILIEAYEAVANALDAGTE
jgi:hypothetical protein